MRENSQKKTANELTVQMDKSDTNSDHETDLGL